MEPEVDQNLQRSGECREQRHHTAPGQGKAGRASGTVTCQRAMFSPASKGLAPTKHASSQPPVSTGCTSKQISHCSGDLCIHEMSYSCLLRKEQLANGTNKCMA